MSPTSKLKVAQWVCCPVIALSLTIHHNCMPTELTTVGNSSNWAKFGCVRPGQAQARCRLSQCHKWRTKHGKVTKWSRLQISCDKVTLHWLSHPELSLFSETRDRSGKVATQSAECLTRLRSSWITDIYSGNIYSGDIYSGEEISTRHLFEVWMIG